MAPAKKSKAKASLDSSGDSLPKPFRTAPDALMPLTEHLDKKHVYVIHIDNKPVELKRKIFHIPIILNIVTIALLALRAWYIGPWYFKLASNLLGHTNDTTFSFADARWLQIADEIARRGLTMLIDFLLLTFVLPEPLAFFLGVGARRNGSPVRWRLAIGFRDREVCVRRSRGWDAVALPRLLDSAEARRALVGHVRQATSPTLLAGKTGYLTAASAAWALDWDAMVAAHRLADAGAVALEAFRVAVLFHAAGRGWLSLDDLGGEGEDDDHRRKQVFAFRDALAAAGKEDLFFRWIELVQFESSQPGGFGAEQQANAARKIREMFTENGIDFDEFWKDSVGSDSKEGLS